ACQDVIGAGEIDGQLQCPDIEVDGVVIELSEVLAGWAIDVCTAFLEGVKSAIEPLDQIRNGAAEVAESPLDSGKPADHAAEDQAGGGQRGIERKATNRNRPFRRHPATPTR